MNLIFVEAVGYFAAAANVFVFVSNTMIPLRIAAIISNGLFGVYFFHTGIYSLCALHAFLLPVNVVRLVQIRRLVSDIRHAFQQANEGVFDYEWLRPYMRPLKLSKGFRLHYKGDLADEAYVLLRGEIKLVEPDVTLKPGAFFGEMGMFTEENRRTASAIAYTDVELLCLRYDDLLQLAAQDPEFSFYLMRLMMRRTQHNLDLALEAQQKNEMPSS